MGSICHSLLLATQCRRVGAINPFLLDLLPDRSAPDEMTLEKREARARRLTAK